MKWLYLGSACYIISAMLQTEGLCWKNGDDAYENLSTISPPCWASRTKPKVQSPMMNKKMALEKLAQLLKDPEKKDAFIKGMDEKMSPSLKAAKQLAQLAQETNKPLFEQQLNAQCTVNSNKKPDRTSVVSMPADLQRNKSDGARQTVVRAVSWTGVLPQATPSVDKKPKLSRSSSWPSFSDLKNSFTHLFGSKKSSKSSSCPASPSTERAGPFFPLEKQKKAKRLLPERPSLPFTAAIQERAYYENSWKLSQQDPYPYMMPSVIDGMPLYHAPAVPGQEAPDWYSIPGNVEYERLPGDEEDDLPPPPSDDVLKTLTSKLTPIKKDAPTRPGGVTGTVQFPSADTKQLVKVKSPVTNKLNWTQQNAQPTSPTPPPRKYRVNNKTIPKTN